MAVDAHQTILTRVVASVGDQLESDALARAKSTREARKDYFAPFARLGAGLGRVVALRAAQYGCNATYAGPFLREIVPHTVSGLRQ